LCDDVLLAWENAGVQGVTILPSTGINRIQQRALLEEMPLIPSLEDFFANREIGNRTLFTVVQDEQIIDQIVNLTQNIVGELSEPNTGILIVLPVVKVYGLTGNKAA
jgi:hypothetical protein